VGHSQKKGKGTFNKNLVPCGQEKGAPGGRKGGTTNAKKKKKKRLDLVGGAATVFRKSAQEGGEPSGGDNVIRAKNAKKSNSRSEAGTRVEKVGGGLTRGSRGR